MKTKRADHSGLHRTFEKSKRFIFRTQTICGICGHPVNFDKVFPDPWSATVDHIIPVSKGGDPVDVSNLQLAHLQCNRIKGTKAHEYKKKEARVSNRDLPLSCDWSQVGNE